MATSQKQGIPAVFLKKGPVSVKPAVAFGRVIEVYSHEQKHKKQISKVLLFL